jgi:hypothetical protein
MDVTGDENESRIDLMVWLDLDLSGFRKTFQSGFAYYA